MNIANYNLQLNKGWLFHKGELDRLPESNHDTTYCSNMAGRSLSVFNMFGEGVEWKSINMPHDWLTEEPYDTTAAVAGGYRKRETAWYYLEFDLPEQEIEEALLVFEGVLGHSTVYVNSTVAARNFSGYTRFFCDVAPYLNRGGKNSIAVYVDARRREGWWYEGAGIYRPAYIEFRSTQKFDSQDYFIRSEKTENGFAVHTTLNVCGVDDHYSVKVTLTDAENREIAVKTVAAQSVTDILQTVDNPVLWSPENPYLYTAKCELIKDGAVYDTVVQKIGIRTIEWKPDGMHLNGARYQIKGICCHQDHVGVGAAVGRELINYRMDILKSLGANAYRCAHHAVSEDVLSYCDEKGLLLMAENRTFSVCPDVYNQLDSLVKHARNHACVFMYSLFNEERWQSEPQGPRIFEKLHKHLLKHDNTRIVAGAQSCGSLNERSHNTTYVMDIVGVNYNVPFFDQIHEKFPEKCILGTENCPTYATRGVYKTEGHYYDCYADQWPTWAQSIDETLQTVNARPFVAGCFPWSGFDYRGEPQPKVWPSVSSHWGFTDYCGFYKDTAYLLMSYYKTELMVHLFPHWNWQKGETVRVCAFTNADTAELFLNGNSQGIKKVENCRTEWQVEYQEGTIEVKAVRGDEVAFDERYTVGNPDKLVLEDSYKPGDSAHIVNVSVSDANGDIIPDFCGEVNFTFPEGAMLGIGNGDPTCHTSERSPVFNLFNGRLQIILTSCGGRLKAECENLVSAEIELI